MGVNDLAHEISRTRALVDQLLVTRLAGLGYPMLSPTHGDVLSQLFMRGDTCMCELSRAIGRDPSTVTALVRKLAALGFVETRKSERDRRSTVVSLTEEGLRLRAPFEQISRELRMSWEEGVDAGDLAACVRVLAAMRGNLAAAIGRCGRGSPAASAGGSKEIEVKGE